jgi:putative phosphoesterase
MKILVISDTHIPITTADLPPQITEAAKKADLCLHAGDFVDYDVFQKLSRLIKIYGVCGNMDDEKVRNELPSQKLLTVEDVTIALTHGGGAPDQLIYYVNDVFANSFAKIDLFIFGHSHRPIDTVIEGKIYFNPGSPTEKIFSPYNSYGELEISGKNIKRKLVKIE